MSKKCGWITSSGRRCVRRCDGIRCYQHQQRETRLEDIGDYAILKSLSFIFPSGIPRKDFLDLFSKLSNDKKRYFLKELGLDPRMTLDDLDKMFYKKVIELQDIPENADEDFEDNLGAIQIDDEGFYMITNPDEIVLPWRDEIKIVFDYPMSKPFVKIVNSANPEGFTKKDLLYLIREGYLEIYDDVDKYGVYGHDIGDLVLEGIKQNDDTLILSIGS